MGHAARRGRVADRRRGHQLRDPRALVRAQQSRELVEELVLGELGDGLRIDRGGASVAPAMDLGSSVVTTPAWRVVHRSRTHQLHQLLRDHQRRQSRGNERVVVDHHLVAPVRYRRDVGPDGRARPTRRSRPASTRGAPTPPAIRVSSRRASTSSPVAQARRCHRRSSVSRRRQRVMVSRRPRPAGP